MIQFRAVIKGFLPWFLSFILAACSTAIPQPTAIQPTPAQSDPSPTPTEAALASPTMPLSSATPEPTPFAEPAKPVNMGEFLLLPDEPLPPADYAELVERLVESGDVSKEEALLAALKVFAGQEPQLELFAGIQPSEGEGSSLLEMANHYLATGENEAVKAEILTMLNIIAPHPDILVKISQPESSASMANVISVSKQNAYQSEDCTDLASRGFNENDEVTCLLYREFALATGNARIYYPSGWINTDDQRLSVVDAAAQALVDSAEVYADFGSMKTIDVIFALLPSKDPVSGEVKPTILASVPFHWPQGKEHCSLIIYPNGVNSALQDGQDRFKQAIAHETFHCFQRWNFPSNNSENVEGNTWWVEGSAEFFSNLVYPSVNREWDWADDFDYKSGNTPIYQMKYESFMLFQFLSNEIGNETIVSLLRSLPGSNDPKVTAQAFSSYPAFQELFHKFGQAYLDREIVDTSGAFIPIYVIIPGESRLYINGDFQEMLEAEPLTLSRYMLNFESEGKHSVDIRYRGANGYESARPGYTKRSWGTMPSIVMTGCSERGFVMLLTTTEAGSNSRTGDFNSVHNFVEVCDACLLGGWSLDIEKYAWNVISPDLLGGQMQTVLNGLAGEILLILDEDGRFTTEANDFLVDYSFSGLNDLRGNPMWVDSVVTYDGKLIGAYWMDEISRLAGSTSGSTILMQQGFSLGSEMSAPRTVNGIVGITPTGSGYPYVCKDDTLTFTYIDPVSSLPMENIYHRTGP